MSVTVTIVKPGAGATVPRADGAICVCGSVTVDRTRVATTDIDVHVKVFQGHDVPPAWYANPWTAQSDPTQSAPLSSDGTWRFTDATAPAGDGAPPWPSTVVVWAVDPLLGPTQEAVLDTQAREFSTTPGS